MYHRHELSIQGDRGQRVPHTLYRHESGSDHLALVLPGLAYTCDMPLLYYPTEQLLHQGADVLLVEYDYRRSWKEKGATTEARLRRLYADVSAAARVALDQRAYAELTLIGKSLGTYALVHLLGLDLSPRPQRALLLTPVLGALRQGIEGLLNCPSKLIVLGTADRNHDPGVLAEVENQTRARVVLLEGANHDLEFPGDLVRSVQALETVVREIQAFLYSSRV